LKLNGSLQLHVDINILGGSIHTIQENTEALVVAGRKSELEVNADKTKFMVMSQDLTAVQSHSRKKVKKSNSI
jgi:hypothetical protein